MGEFWYVTMAQRTRRQRPSHEHRGAMGEFLSALMLARDLCLVVDLQSSGSDQDEAVQNVCPIGFTV